MKKHALASAVVFLLLGAAAYGALFVAPTEKTMGTIQRIFYLHVSSAWTGLTSFFICFLANLMYVWRRELRWDWLAVSAAEVGLVFTTVVLVTGPIWAHPVWGIWWTWDARLTSTFVLWLLYISYLLLRTLVEEPDRRALLSALFGIFAFIDVPIVLGAIRWWRTQHPAPGMRPTFYFAVLAMHILMWFLISERYALEKMRGEVDVLRREAEAS